MDPCLRRYLPGCVALALNMLWVANLVAAAESLPIASWPFDEASGSFATDSSSNGHTATIFSGDGATVNDGQWHHIAVVFERAGSMTRYVDGLQTGTRYSLASLSGQNLDNTNQVQIGARDQAGDRVFFRGQIDDARIYALA